MRSQITLTISALFFCSLILSNCMATDNPLRTTLEKSWKNYLQASKSGSESELEKAMSSFRFATMKNNLISANRSLTPEIIKSITDNAPDISKTKFETLLENGATAGLVYVSDSEEKDESGKARVKFVFIKFVQEKGEWKVDAGMEIGSLKFQDDGKESKFDPSDLPPTYEIDGQVLNPPKLIEAPEITAFLDIFSMGYQIQVSVNGERHETVVNKSFSGLLKGGIHKGKNSIVIDVKKVDKDVVSKPTVNIRRAIAGNKTIEVFKFEPNVNIEGKHQFDFSVGE